MTEAIRKFEAEWRKYFIDFLIVAVSTLVFIQGREYFAKSQWALLYLLIIVLVASRSGVRSSIVTAVTAFLAWNYFLLPPYHTFSVSDPKDWLSLFIFLGVGIAMGLQTGKLKQREALAKTRERETSLLNTFSAHLVSDLSIDEMADILASDVAESMKARSAVLFIPADQNRLVPVGSLATSIRVKSEVMQMAEWSYRESTAIGFPDVDNRHKVLPDGWPVSVSHEKVGIDAPRNDIVIPLHTASRQVGVLYIGGKDDGRFYSVSEARMLMAIANQSAAFLERKLLNSIAVQADALREADRMKSTFVSSVSHELKTPLASITATVTNLLENDLTWDDASVKEELSAVRDDLDRLNDSISSLVDLSRLESSAWSPNRDNYELGEILGTVLTKLPMKQSEQISFSLPDDLPSIYVDYAQWVRVFVILIENALSYSGSDDGVYIGASYDENIIKMWVEDRGFGIPQEERGRIFDKFYRGSTSAKVTSGTGLGLAIAREIVRSHDGKIWVEDAKPHGARFVIMLPQNGEDQTLEHS
ncbi:MAG: DUF4118 domain-containing protein [Armatimonadota bacterium]